MQRLLIDDFYCRGKSEKRRIEIYGLVCDLIEWQCGPLERLLVEESTPNR
jgi:hypothetical protein